MMDDGETDRQKSVYPVWQTKRQRVSLLHYDAGMGVEIIPDDRPPTPAHHPGLGGTLEAGAADGWLPEAHRNAAPCGADYVSLSAAMPELEHDTGNVWTHILSLYREDAERLGYNNAQAG